MEYGAKIVQIALRNEVTAYAASYVALARSKACLLITADEKLRKKALEEKYVERFHDYESIRVTRWKFPERDSKASSE